tara:strand:- start:268 stop:519 length:252 start_codon:yes stop_codon:yes gene_type:complete
MFKMTLLQLLSRLRTVNRLGEDILRTHQHLSKLNKNITASESYKIEGLQRVQEERIQDFEETLDHAINDWDKTQLNKYWTGYS